MRSARFAFADGGRAVAGAVLAVGLSTGIVTAAGADPLADPVVAVDPVTATAPVLVPGDPVAVPAATDAAGGQRVGTDMPMPMPMSVDPADGLSVSIGGSYLGGDFGFPTNSKVAVLFGNVRYRAGDTRLNATLPWMDIRSDGTIFTGIDGVPLIVAPTRIDGGRHRRGLADLTVGASWLALSEDSVGADVELSGRVKIPTASDSSGLSTGKFDYAVAAEVSRTVGVVTPSVRVGYRFLGDFDGMDLRNGLSTSIGASVVLFQRSVALLSYDYTQRASRFIRDAHELSLGLSTPLGDRLRLNSYGSIGMSSGAADLSAGVSLTIGFGSLRPHA